jgi:uncharacterized protein (DUF1697 family)
VSECIALLRGINVGKAKRIPMADLRRLLEDLGHTNVRTLLNSGNAVFRPRDAAPGKLAHAIEQAIVDRFGIEVPVVVVAAPELATIVAANPLPQATVEPSRFLVAFVQEPQSLAAANALTSQTWAPEAFALGRRAAYLWCANGIIESKLAQAFARATRDAATARNWATALKLQAMVAPGQNDG